MGFKTYIEFINESSLSKALSDVINDVYSFNKNGYRITFMIRDSSVTAQFYHNKMDKIEWFDIDNTLKFSTETGVKEMFTVESLIEAGILDDETMMNNEIFSTWIKNFIHTNRGAFPSKKYNI